MFNPRHKRTLADVPLQPIAKVTGAILEPGAPAPLFQPKILAVNDVDAGLQYDVARDGWCLINTVSDDTSPITVFVNWAQPKQ
jgi:hypothetical protein